ncbi:hypothetical protein SpCBS45565_g08086 [Spizellomyces sp. 'palustris']|nr:hypothetical protein SpCBS45565_g08086 [Spizellomyces sp. 'palustris']
MSEGGFVPVNTGVPTDYSDWSNMEPQLPYRFLLYLPASVVNQFKLYTLSPFRLSLLLSIATLVLWALLLYLRQRLLLTNPVTIYHAPRTVGIKRAKRQVGKRAGESIEQVPLHKLIRQECPTLADPKGEKNVFSPTPYLANGHLQTIFAALFADYAKPRIEYTRELIYFPDGGNVALDWHPALPPSASEHVKTPIIVILHGLTGGSHETYVQDVVEEVAQRGYRAVVSNFRGCAQTELTSEQLYCGAYTGDLRYALDYIRRRCPDAPLFGVGFSLGANVLTKFVGETGESCPFIGAVAVANPFDLLLGSHVMHSTWFGRNIYSKRMTQNLIRVFKRHMHRFTNSNLVDVDQLMSARFIYEFDDMLTRKSFKYRTVHEYYRQGSSAQFVPDVRRPMLLFSALDDPVAPKEAIPFFEVKENPYVILGVTPHGGHLGWFQGMKPTRWFAKPVSEFIFTIVESYRSLPHEEKHHPVASNNLPVTARRISFSTPLPPSLPTPHAAPREIPRPGPVSRQSSAESRRSVSSAPPVPSSSMAVQPKPIVKPKRHPGLFVMRLVPRNRILLLLLGILFGYAGGRRRAIPL